MKYLYPDTSIWNCLCDQDADPNALSSALANRGIGLVIGFNVLYEMAKPFFTGTNEATERGRQLLTYLNHYLALGVPIVKENWALLIEEALDVTGHTPMKSCFRDNSQYEMTVHEIDKLLRGEITPEVVEFFAGRKSLVRTSRTAMKNRLDDRPEVKAIFAKTSDEDLSHFLSTATTGMAGQFMLLGHLRMEFPKDSPDDLAAVSALLLRSPKYRLSHALTRTDLYLNWRWARRGSIRADSPDDAFHIVSAAYCDIFATREADQADIAHHAIEGIQTLVVNEDEIVADRLVSAQERKADDSQDRTST